MDASRTCRRRQPALVYLSSQLVLRLRTRQKGKACSDIDRAGVVRAPPRSSMPRVVAPPPVGSEIVPALHERTPALDDGIYPVRDVDRAHWLHQKLIYARVDGVEH